MNFTPEQVDAVHNMNDFMSETMGRLRTMQSRVTQLVAVIAREHKYPDSDQCKMEAMFASTKIDYDKLECEMEELPPGVEPTEEHQPTRVDLRVSTAFALPLHDDAGYLVADYCNVEFQFDEGVFVGMRTLIGTREVDEEGEESE